MKTINPIIARVLIILIFFSSGINFLMDPQGTQAYMEMQGMTKIPFFYFGAIALLLIGSVSIISGYYMQYGAILLIVFLVPATIIFHGDIAQPTELIQVLKNAGLLGGLILIYNMGNHKPLKEKQKSAGILASN